MASSAGGRLGRRTQLPLIFCPDCRWRKVVELTSHTSNNPDKVFFTCPNQKKGKPGCEFYLWEDEYVEYLRLNHGYKGLVGQQGGDEGLVNSTILEVDEEASALIGTGAAGHAADGGTTQITETLKEQDLLANSVKDISVLLKALIAIALCGLVVMICNLVVFLFK